MTPPRYRIVIVAEGTTLAEARGAATSLATLAEVTSCPWVHTLPDSNGRGVLTVTREEADLPDALTQ